MEETSNKLKDKSRLTVISLDSNIDLKNLDPKFYKTYDQPQPEKSELLKPEVQEALFLKAGLTTDDLKNFDEFAKDYFYLEAKHNPLNYLRQKYPKIAFSKLRLLQTLIQKSESRK